MEAHEDSKLLLRGLSTCSFTHKLTHSKLQFRGRSSKSTRYLQAETKLTSFREMAGGPGARADLSGDRHAGRLHCFFDVLSSHPAGLVQVGATSEFSINLANTIHPTLVTP